MIDEICHQCLRFFAAITFKEGKNWGKQPTNQTNLLVSYKVFSRVQLDQPLECTKMLFLKGTTILYAIFIYLLLLVVQNFCPKMYNRLCRFFVLLKNLYYQVNHRTLDGLHLLKERNQHTFSHEKIGTDRHDS